MGRGKQLFNHHEILICVLNDLSVESIEEKPCDMAGDSCDKRTNPTEGAVLSLGPHDYSSGCLRGWERVSHPIPKATQSFLLPLCLWRLQPKYKATSLAAGEMTQLKHLLFSEKTQTPFSAHIRQLANCQ